MQILQSSCVHFNFNFNFAMTNLVLISSALDYLVLYDNKRLCSDAKQEKQGMGYPHHHGNKVFKIK